MAQMLSVSEMLQRVQRRLQELQQELQQLETNCDITKGRIVTFTDQLKELEGTRRSLRGAFMELNTEQEYLQEVEKREADPMETLEGVSQEEGIRDIEDSD